MIKESKVILASICVPLLGLIICKKSFLIKIKVNKIQLILLSLNLNQ